MRKWMALFEDSGLIDDVTKQAAELGVDLHVFESDDHIQLHWIERRHNTTKGHGAKVMDMVCAYADRVGKSIILQLDGANSEALEAYYGDWDFDHIDHYEDWYPDWDEDEVLIRRPRGIQS